LTAAAVSPALAQASAQSSQAQPETPVARPELEFRSAMFHAQMAPDQPGFRSGKTYDWTDWNGTPYGYEGLLVDGYYLTLLAAMPAGPK
jgi:hypothetical protein